MDNYNSPFIFVIVDFLASVNKEIWYPLSAVYLLSYVCIGEFWEGLLLKLEAFQSLHL